MMGYSPLNTQRSSYAAWPAIYKPQLEMIHSSWGHIQSEKMRLQRMQVEIGAREHDERMQVEARG